MGLRCHTCSVVPWLYQRNTDVHIVCVFRHRVSVFGVLLDSPRVRVLRLLQQLVGCAVRRCPLSVSSASSSSPPGPPRSPLVVPPSSPSSLALCMGQLTCVWVCTR